jgi:hypothetical protein
MIWHCLVGRNHTVRNSWHYPAMPYAFETLKNSARLLPTFIYSFKQRGDQWIVYDLYFSSVWKCDRATGNIIVPSLDAWSKISDNANHFRQAKEWPRLVRSCDSHPDAPAHSDFDAEDVSDDPYRSSESPGSENLRLALL